MNYSKHFSGILTFLIIPLFILSSCDSSKESKKKAQAKKIIIGETETFFGWNTLYLENPFARIDVVPELGGRIMGYKSNACQVLWHNPVHEGKLEPFQKNETGEPYVDPGGAKVWPAPGNAWKGPPDPILDIAPYTCNSDGKTITVTSPGDNGPDGTGLQFIHTYSLTPFSSLVNLNLSMKNTADHKITWALWHLASIPADGKRTIYAPAEGKSWDIIEGDNNSTQWLSAENDILMVKYNKIKGKAGAKVREGWLAMHEEEKNIVFAILFPIKNNAKYPNGGHHIEIKVTAGANDSSGVFQGMEYIELAVFGPLAELSPGISDSLSIRWGVCKASGVVKVTPIGIVSERIKVDDKNIATGKFGVFYTGTLEEFFVDKDGNKKGRSLITDVSPINEINLSRELSVPKDAVSVRYQIVDSERHIIGIIGEAPLPIPKEKPLKPKRKGPKV